MHPGAPPSGGAGQPAARAEKEPQQGVEGPTEFLHRPETLAGRMVELIGDLEDRMRPRRDAGAVGGR